MRTTGAAARLPASSPVACKRKHTCKTSMLPKATSALDDSLARSEPNCRVGPTAVAPMMHSKGPFLLPSTCTSTLTVSIKGVGVGTDVGMNTGVGRGGAQGCKCRCGCDL